MWIVEEVPIPQTSEGVWSIDHGHKTITIKKLTGTWLEVYVSDHATQGVRCVGSFKSATPLRQYLYLVYDIHWDCEE